jgi:hypothetical protein
MVDAVGPMKERVDHEVSAEYAKREKRVERYLCLPKTDADPSTARFSIAERVLKSYAEFIRTLLGHHSGRRTQNRGAGVFARRTVSVLVLQRVRVLTCASRELMFSHLCQHRPNRTPKGMPAHA